MVEGQQRADIVLHGGRVVDGTGTPARGADIAVKGERIAAIGDLSRWRAKLALDVGGLTVSPGFIDMHSHSDLALLIVPRAESKLRQGVTTEVIGMCGFSAAPAPPERREEIRGMFGAWGKEVDWAWGSFGDYLGKLRSQGTSVNAAPVVGHSIVRAGVMGEENRPPTSSELSAMQRAVSAAMGQGAMGLSTGLVYAPGMFARTEELIALARAIAPWKGIYFSHIRSEGEGLLRAVGEAVEIGRQAGVAVQIAHLKASGKQNWGNTLCALAAIEKARQDGVDVSFDAYPYTAWNTGLGQLLPAWAREGGQEAMLGRLRDRTTRARLQEALREAAEADPGRWDRRLLASVDSDANRPLQGLTLAQIAERRGASPEEVVIDLLLEEQGQASMVGFGMCEEDVKRVISHPTGMIGSDAAAVAPYGVLGQGHPHPRAYGTFPRVLGRYVREERALSLETAVSKMTSIPAEKLGLKDRGRLGVGMAADIVVFDPQTIADQATYQSPHEYPVGVRYVIVNGVLELDGETHRDELPGVVLNRQL